MKKKMIGAMALVGLLAASMEFTGCGENVKTTGNETSTASSVSNSVSTENIIEESATSTETSVSNAETTEGSKSENQPEEKNESASGEENVLTANLFFQY